MSTSPLSSLRHVRALGLVVGLLLLVASAVVGVTEGRQAARERFDSSLDGTATSAAQVLEEYFARAGAIDLLMANVPSVTEYFGEGSPSVSPGRGHHVTPPEITRINGMLTYLETLYAGSISETCLITVDGVEVARSVLGEVAHPADLSHDEDDNAFFVDTLATPVGRVHQARPYRSPDTDEWVISNSTVVPDSDGEPAAVMHFEVSLDSFREQLRTTDPAAEVRVVDLETGRTVLTTDAAPTSASLRAPADSAGRQVAQASGSGGAFDDGGDRVAFRKLASSPDNLNHWAVLVSKPYAASIWSTAPGRGALATGLAALVLLATSLLTLVGRQRDLRRRATTDPLTGLANRAVLLERLGTIEVPQGGGTTMLMLMDLDGFKEVNDTLGHSHGDVLLCEVARRIRSSVRESDLAVRLGGDEFAVLLEDVPGGRAAAESLAGRILSSIRQSFHLEGVGVRVDASLGIAILGEHGGTADMLLQRADVAMYRAKNNGLGSVFYDPEDDPHSTRRLGLTAGLLEAIEKRQFELHYQPKVDTTTGEVVALEALIRWVHPTLGPLCPSEFVPLAEKTGLIRPLTEAVLDLALAQCKVWRSSGRALTVAVNVSALDLVGDTLVERIAALLAAHGLPPHALQLELTESAIMADPDRAQHTLERLAGMGVLLAVDDYGTGYASLTYLKRLPVTELKVDRLFVSGVTHDDADRMIVKSTIQLAHSLGMSVVAEGVEDLETLDFLREERCDVAQGFYLTRPLPAAEITAWLEHQSDGDARAAEPALA